MSRRMGDSSRTRWLGAVAALAVVLGVGAALGYRVYSGSGDADGGDAVTAAAPASTAAASASTAASSPMVPSAVSAAPVSLAANVEQFRGQAAQRVVRIRLTNTGPEEIRLVQVELASAGFAAGPATPQRQRLTAGQTASVGVQLGEVRCDGQPLDAVARLQLTRSAGPVRGSEVAIAPGDGLLERLHSRECEQQLLAGALQLGFGPDRAETTVADEPALRTSVVLRRTGSAEPLELRTLESSVIFELQPEQESANGAALLRLEPGQDQAAVPVLVTTPRCEPHALAESKQTYVLPARVRVGAGPELATTVAVTPADRARLDAFLLVGCDLTP